MERRARGNSFEPHPVFMRYQKLDKHFAQPEMSESLYDVYTTLRKDKPYPFYLFAAGSAAAEAGIVGEYDEPGVRHGRIDEAVDAWKDAQQKYIESHCDDNWSQSKLLAFPDRIQAHVLFAPLFHDLINQDVRPETCANVHNQLVRLSVQNMTLLDNAQRIGDRGAESARKGLAYELTTIAVVTRLQCPSYFAIPTICRADDGTFNKSTTHDVQLVEQSWGKIRSAVPIEVKPSGNYQRSGVESALVRGRIHLRLPSHQSAFTLPTALKHELDGTATQEEIQELNTVTSRILEVARTYKIHRGLSARALAS